MSIKVQSNYSDTKLHNVRRIIVDDTEKFRVVAGGNNELVYGKGKINFDLNWPKDGQGRSFGESPYFYGKQITKYLPVSSLYVFYEDGFYKPDSYIIDKFYKYDTENLSDIVWNIYESKFHAIKFKGWWTASSGGNEIKTLQDVQTKTRLFSYNSKDGLPQITLYAHWDVPKYTVTVCNILKGQGGFSSFYNKETGQTVAKTSVTFKDVVYGTDMEVFLQNKISNVKYFTWASNLLNGSNPQKFLGWSEEQYEYNGSKSWRMNNSQGITKNMKIYPHFEILFVCKKIGFGSNTFYFNNSNQMIYISSTGGGYLLRKSAMNISVIAENTPYPQEAGFPVEFFRYTKSNGRYTGHYRYIWHVETKDYSSSQINSSSNNGGRDVPLSSTIVYTIKSVSPYWWQLEGYY